MNRLIQRWHILSHLISHLDSTSQKCNQLWHLTASITFGTLCASWLRICAFTTIHSLLDFTHTLLRWASFRSILYHMLWHICDTKPLVNLAPTQREFWKYKTVKQWSDIPFNFPCSQNLYSALYNTCGSGPLLHMARVLIHLWKLQMLISTVILLVKYYTLKQPTNNMSI